MLSIPLITLTAAVFLSGCVAADDVPDSLAAARSHWLHGRYEEAAEIYQSLLSADSKSVAAALGLSRCHEARGRYADAAKVIASSLELVFDNADLEARLAELAFARGDWTRAEQAAAAAIAEKPDHVLARWIAAQLADARGEFDKSRTLYEWFVHYYNRSEAPDADSLLIIGRGASEYAQRTLRGREQAEQLNAVLNEMFDGASEAEQGYWPARLASGLLFLEKHRKGDALKDLKAALAMNPNAADLHVALGLASLENYDIDEGLQHADRALEINPYHAAARRLKADLYFIREQFDEAVAELEQARAINPIDEETLARFAACLLLTRRTEEFEQLRAEVIARNPRPAVFLWRLGDRLESLRRFDQAEHFLHAAIDADAARPGPRTDLGMLYMRVGKETEAATTLNEAFEADPFNVRTKNMLEVLDQLSTYESIETEHFRIRVDKADKLLGHFAAKYLEEVYTELTEQFGYRPEGLIQIEIFNKGRGQTAHQWFSARTVGLPWIGTVGACTGKVVAMASPYGVEKPFNWARVLKHEVVHVITLQQTHFNIPHWYTEALAVQAEGYPRPQVWNELLVSRVPAGELFDLGDINLAFARPNTALDWQMAYCQAEQYAEYMQARFGRDSTARLLDAYRDGLSTTEAVEKVTGVAVADFETGYVEHLQKVARGLRAGPTEPTWSPAELERAHASNPDDPDIAARLANHQLARRNYPKARELAMRALQKQPDHPLASYVLARLSQLIGDEDRARQLLEPALKLDSPDPRVLQLLADLQTRAKQFDRAKELYELARQRYPAESKWVAGLARVALHTGDRSGLYSALQELMLLDADDPSPRKKLATMAAEDEDWDKVEQYAWSVLHIDVTDFDMHLLLAESHAKRNRWEQAADQYRVASELQPESRSVALKLAQALHKADRRDDAEAVLTKLLERDPQNAAARELLDELNR